MRWIRERSVCNVIRRNSLVTDMSLNLAARLVKSRGGSIARRIPWSVSGRLYICSANSIDRALTSGLHRADRETSRAARYFLRSPDKGSKKTGRRMVAVSERKPPRQAFESATSRKMSVPKCKLAYVILYLPHHSFPLRSFFSYVFLFTSPHFFFPFLDSENILSRIAIRSE